MKKFGIKMTETSLSFNGRLFNIRELRPDGTPFEWLRWYDTEANRDKALETLETKQEREPYNMKFNFERVER